MKNWLLTKRGADGTTAARELKKLIHIEKARKTAQKHGWYLKQKRKGMVNHILIPAVDGESDPPWSRISEPEELFR